VSDDCILLLSLLLKKNVIERINWMDFFNNKWITNLNQQNTNEQLTSNESDNNSNNSNNISDNKLENEIIEDYYDESPKGNEIFDFESNEYDII
jgi:hypothetical protein